MKIYFAGSVRGGRNKKADYIKIIKALSNFSIVLTEHIGDEHLSVDGEIGKSDTFIYERDKDYIDESDIVIADVSVPSLGVGYELGYAEAKGKKILCLYQAEDDKILSAMIAGNKNMKVVTYDVVDSLLPILEKEVNFIMQ